jgi:N-acetylglucosaminyl-diphospho-decaprenol L-rhamnosyltransferase
MTDGDISIVVVSYNSNAVLEECLRRLCNHYANAEIIVVNSGDSQGLVSLKNQYPHIGWLQVENRGYAFAVNQGLKVSTQPFWVQMNSDVYVEAGDLEALKAAFTPKTAFVGPVLVTPFGKRQNLGPAYALNYWNLHRSGSSWPVGWVAGALTMGRKDILEELGGMDERFFFYNEDLEWGLRAKRKGWQVLLVNRKVLHIGGASTPNDPRFLAEGYRGGLLISQDYYPLLHGFHKKVVWLEALLRSYFDPRTQKRQSYRLVWQMLQQNQLERSFFIHHPTQTF